MDLQAQSISKSLRYQFKAQGISLSRKGSDSEANQIKAVIDGIRYACLLSFCTASKAALTALQRILSDKSKYGDDLAVVVHQPSQQAFIVNVNLLCESYKTAKGPLLYYAIDTDIDESKRVRYDPPQYLREMLECLVSSLTELDRTKSCIPVLLLNSDDSSSFSGVALAGYLLGYHVVYFFDTPLSASSCQMWFGTDAYEESNWLDQSKENNLSGIPLVLIKANTSNGHTLYQYTFPSLILEQVAITLDVNGNIEEVLGALKRHTHSSLQLTYEIVTISRVMI